MTTSFLQVLLSLAAGIGLIVLLTVRFRVHAFFALFLACFAVGLGVQLPFTEIINTMKDGFGHILRSLGFIIMLGTMLGVILEYTGATRVMAAAILKIVGEKRAAVAMGITGFIVGLPIFCDSGYIVLSGLNRSVARRSGASILVMSVSLASGLYAVHCLIPPHPGATAAAGIIGADIGKLILTGALVAIPAAVAGCWWAAFMGKRIPVTDTTEEHEPEELPDTPAWKAFLPIILPIVLIATGAFSDLQKGGGVWHVFGDPVVALAVGVLLAFYTGKNWKRAAVSHLMTEAAEKAGGILVIIGAGGAFGAILATTKIGDHFSSSLQLGHIGIIFPFLLTVLLKTAQGSSTVAIITAASIIQPLLPVLGLDSDMGRLLCMLALGGGSMMISHANDAYFWVISKFSGLEMNPMLKVYSGATIIMGMVTFAIVYALSLILL
ncbi:GntP family permease [Chitinophaga barathri]|uniref:GntP family permease n=1 Tax=Chitinophaga barathri TaxID=1647451 RepID=A0A3N4MAR9_9BACT|nr:GntP family permease [Chitinophaga barathri]RPD40884.1 GntP family permease [Chitinophaga barathri]